MNFCIRCRCVRGLQVWARWITPMAVLAFSKRPRIPASPTIAFASSQFTLDNDEAVEVLEEVSSEKGTKCFLVQSCFGGHQGWLKSDYIKLA